MDKKELFSQIEQVQKDVVGLSTDKRKTKKLLADLLSLKGQCDVEPTRMYIPEKSVIKEYDNDNIRIVRCADCIIWQHKGGMSIVVNPTMRALYLHLESMLSMKDRYDQLTDDEKTLYNSLYFGTSLILQSALFAVADDEFFANLAMFIGDGVKKVGEKLLNRPLQEETPIENAAFDAKMGAAEELQNDVKRA